MSAGIRIFDANNGVDVRVGLLNDLGQVLNGQLGVVPVDLLHADGHAGRVHAARTIGVDQAAVTRLNPQPVAGLLTAPEQCRVKTRYLRYMAPVPVLPLCLSVSRKDRLNLNEGRINFSHKC